MTNEENVLWKGFLAKGDDLSSAILTKEDNEVWLEISLNGTDSNIYFQYDGWSSHLERAESLVVILNEFITEVRKVKKEREKESEENG